MKLSSVTKAIYTSCLLLLVVALGALAYGHFTSFRGVCRVERGGLVASAEVSALDAEAEASRFELPRLPFTLRLDEVETLGGETVHHQLALESIDGVETITVSEGSVVTLADRELRVEALRLWDGLLRRSSGIPMAWLTLARPGELPGQVVVSNGQWVAPVAELSVSFTWASSAEEARAATGQPLAPETAARWGVTEGPHIHWIQSLVPGAQVRLANDANVTLLAYEPERPPGDDGTGPAVLLEVARHDVSAMTWVRANSTDKSGLLHFECPAAHERVIRLAAWRDGLLLAAPFLEGAPLDPVTLREGETWAYPDAALALRLEQVLEGAVPVWAGESNVEEVVLSDGEQRLRVREGETVPWRGVGISFRRAVGPAEYLYVFTHPDREDKEAIRLETGEVERLKGWRLAVLEGDSESAVVSVSRSTSTQAMKAGIALALVGGTVVAARRVAVRMRNA